NVAVNVVEELGLADEIAVAALAKRFEEVYVPGQADPVRIPRQSEALYLLQRIRDEAHRFAITYHRQLRGKRMTKSVIDDVARLAAYVGVSTVVGIDPTWAQLSVAQQRGGAPAYCRGVADALPFPSGSFDAVVACLVFEHIEAVDEALAEVGRVLKPGGRFLFFLNHPLLQTPGSGWIDDRILDEQYWRIGAYLVEDSGLEE